MANTTIKHEMAVIDTKNRSWYDSLNDEEKKKLSPWVLMRFASSVKNNSKDIEFHYLEWVNELVNVHFNVLRHHPQLQLQLMQAVGIGKQMYHPWLAPSKGVKLNKLAKVFSDLHPSLNDDELDLVMSQYSKKDVTNMLEELGTPKKDIKKLIAGLK